MSFFGLAGAGALAVALVWLAMPETREAAPKKETEPAVEV
jgi:predicted MFS family arabinose efflux permease